MLGFSRQAAAGERQAGLVSFCDSDQTGSLLPPRQFNLTHTQRKKQDPPICRVLTALLDVFPGSFNEITHFQCVKFRKAQQCSL